jgi:hypothetical protein
MGPVGCPEISILKCHSMLRKISERRSHLQRDGSLKSHNVVLSLRKMWNNSTLWSVKMSSESLNLEDLRDGRAMARAVSRRPLTAEARVRFWISPYGICGGQSGTGTGFPPLYFGFPLSISFHRCSITRKNEDTNHLHHRVAQ